MPLGRPRRPLGRAEARATARRTGLAAARVADAPAHRRWFGEPTRGPTGGLAPRATRRVLRRPRRYGARVAAPAVVAADPHPPRLKGGGGCVAAATAAGKGGGSGYASAPSPSKVAAAGHVGRQRVRGARGLGGGRPRVGPPTPVRGAPRRTWGAPPPRDGPSHGPPPAGGGGGRHLRAAPAAPVHRRRHRGGGWVTRAALPARFERHGSAPDAAASAAVLVCAPAKHRLAVGIPAPATSFTFPRHHTSSRHHVIIPPPPPRGGAGGGPRRRPRPPPDQPMSSFRALITPVDGGDVPHPSAARVRRAFRWDWHVRQGLYALITPAVTWAVLASVHAWMVRVDERERLKVEATQAATDDAVRAPVVATTTELAARVDALSAVVEELVAATPSQRDTSGAAVKATRPPGGATAIQREGEGVASADSASAAATRASRSPTVPQAPLAAGARTAVETAAKDVTHRQLRPPPSPPASMSPPPSPPPPSLPPPTQSERPALPTQAPPQLPAGPPVATTLRSPGPDPPA
ncbi:hypothetical protein BU14_0027s0022 [Porphyra umbilicalis]|uniref:Uncharacterized protein n=1 Tax=Porphyra umbilicalis TaxID=2786 RepID=A0A1X6PJG7_PORUM|nr:hypothetical protein BU14_0027s0022 [Porphyra umbilicalis]|eukprot:OSX80997.1 hypothetical protein BU14_0027s0022 [Porphyra umbilicalis]